MRKWVMDEFLISGIWYLVSDFKIKSHAQRPLPNALFSYKTPPLFQWLLPPSILA
jgi:hypothetical protein